jgi:hypothetical protein
MEYDGGATHAGTAGSGLLLACTDR